MTGLHLLFSCEHGGNRIPPRYFDVFASREARLALASHRGWDEGALPLARALARGFRAPIISSTISRLLVDLNRSEGHHALFSEFSRRLTDAQKQKILEQYHRAYRTQVESAVASFIGNAVRDSKTVLHVSVHSFTPIWNGVKRRTDIGLLYDPARPEERSIAARWKNALEENLGRTGLCVSRNAPYRGSSDGLTRTLRRRFADRSYAGFELEINQRHMEAGGRFSRTIEAALAKSLADLGA